MAKKKNGTRKEENKQVNQTNKTESVDYILVYSAYNLKDDG
jgi:hypothetical protein